MLDGPLRSVEIIVSLFVLSALLNPYVTFVYSNFTAPITPEEAQETMDEAPVDVVNNQSR